MCVHFYYGNYTGKEKKKKSKTDVQGSFAPEVISLTLE